MIKIHAIRDAFANDRIVEIAQMRLRQYVRQLELLQQSPGFGRGIFPCSKPRALNSQRTRKRKIENWIVRK
jgi:hypothetical protein